MGALESLRDGDWNGVRQNFNLLGRLLGLVTKDSDGFGLTVAGVGTRFGTTTVTFTASASSATRTFPHGLGRIPQSVQLTPYANMLAQIVSKDATNVSVFGYHVPGTNVTGTFSIDWMVIG